MEIIEATRPIALVHVAESSSPFTECPQNMTMAVYLPKRLHSNPPLTGYAAVILPFLCTTYNSTRIRRYVIYTYSFSDFIIGGGSRT